MWLVHLAQVSSEYVGFVPRLFSARLSNRLSFEDGLHCSQPGGAALLSLRVALFGSNEVVSLTTLTVGGLVLVLWRHLQLGGVASSDLLLG